MGQEEAGVFPPVSTESPSASYSNLNLRASLATWLLHREIAWRL